MNQITSLDRRVDARINGLTQRARGPRNPNNERSREGRPTCFSCGMLGHYQNSSPQRNNSGRHLVPRYALPTPDTRVRYSNGPQTSLQALPPPSRPNRVAAFDRGNAPEPSLASGYHLEPPANELCDQEYFGEWGYYDDYGYEDEGYPWFDGVAHEQYNRETAQQRDISALTEDPQDPTAGHPWAPCDIQFEPEQLNEKPQQTHSDPEDINPLLLRCD